MQVVLLAALALVGCVSASVRVESVVGYHDRVAIPMASKIKAAEDSIQATVNRNARIVGGGAAAPYSHPYFAGLLATYVNRPGIGVCGAVLVSRSRLLTAAHCWFDGVVQTERFVVVLGSLFLFSGGHRTDSSDVVTYPDWDPENSINNLAVIKLRLPVFTSPTIQPIALPTNPNETFTGEWGIAAGFGFTSETQTSIPVLSVVHEVKLQVISFEQCRSTFGSIVQPNTVCTSGAGGVGTCLGDAGGPLVSTDTERQLIGIATFGAAVGCERGFPSGFSRITSFLPFINKHL